mgnify:CR=1 FL=1
MLENQPQILDELMSQVKDTQMTRDEYKFISDLILSINNCNTLIFGTGRDSQLWVESNKNGKTTFLEPDEKWVKIAQEKTPNIDIRHIQYTTLPSQALSMFFDYKRTGKMKNIPLLFEDIITTEWDIILIDSPVGGVNGRMSSIFISDALSKSTKKDTHIFLHDCEREVEMLWSHLFLLPNSKEVEEHNWDTNNFTKLNYYIK